MYQVRSTKYGLEFFPHLANSYHRPDTFSMSNAQPRSKNVEVGIRVLTQIVLLKDLGTWYFACLPQAGTSYKKKRLIERSASFLEVDLISSRTHQMSSSRSTWNLQLGYPMLVCNQCC